MAICVQVAGDGALTTDGSGIAGCTGFIAMTPTEYAAMQPLLEPLTIAEGEAIGSAILVLWAIAFGFRAIRKSLDQEPVYEGD
jgi:hypothetical protein